MSPAPPPVVTKMIADGKGGLYMAAGSHLCHLATDGAGGTETVTLSPTFATEGGVPLSPAMAISPAGDMVAVIDMAKNVTVLDTTKGGVLLRGVLEKGAMCAVFSSKGTLLVGDKFGDIAQFSLADGGDKVNVSPALGPVKATVIAGCVSMVTDLAIYEQGDAILMADRDEKIRVIGRRKPWIIDGFCLGHTEYVAGIGLLGPSSSWMVSLGGDARLILWDLHDCTRTEQVISVVDSKGDSDFDPFSFCVGASSLSFFTRGSQGSSTVYTFDFDTSGAIPAISSSPRTVDLDELVTALAYCTGDTLVVATERGGLLTMDKGQGKPSEVASLERFTSSLPPTSTAHPTFSPLTVASTLRKRRYQFESATKRRRAGGQG